MAHTEKNYTFPEGTLHNVPWSPGWTDRKTPAASAPSRETTGTLLYCMAELEATGLLR